MRRVSERGGAQCGERSGDFLPAPRAPSTACSSRSAPTLKRREESRGCGTKGERANATLLLYERRTRRATERISRGQMNAGRAVNRKKKPDEKAPLTTAPEPSGTSKLLGRSRGHRYQHCTAWRAVGLVVHAIGGVGVGLIVGFHGRCWRETRLLYCERRTVSPRSGAQYAGRGALVELEGSVARKPSVRHQGQALARAKKAQEPQRRKPRASASGWDVPAHVRIRKEKQPTFNLHLAEQ